MGAGCGAATGATAGASAATAVAMSAWRFDSSSATFPAFSLMPRQLMSENPTETPAQM